MFYQTNRTQAAPLTMHWTALRAADGCDGMYSAFLSLVTLVFDL